MKRIFLKLLIPLCLLVLVLGGCVRRERAMQQQAMLDEYCTITYYQGETVLATERIAPGKTPESIPAGEYIWLDAAGERVDPTSVVVEEDIAFYVWTVPSLQSGYVRFLTTQNNMFYPEENVTRADTAAMLYALLDKSMLEDMTEGTSFSDVPEGSDYEQAIRTVEALGLLEGYSDGTFRPDASISRAEFAQILYYLRGEFAAGTQMFSDIDQNHWAYDALSWVAEQEILIPEEGNAVSPDKPVTRAEAVVMLNRFRGREPNRVAIDLACENPPYEDVLPDYWAFYDIVDASYSNELMSYIIGEIKGVEPGMIFIDDEMCHLNGETFRLDYYVKGFHTIDGGLYYVPRNGYFIQRFEEGLVELDGSMFYVTETDGPFLTEGSFGYLDFGADGRYTSGSESVDAHVDRILADILSDDSQSQEEKLYEAYCAIRDGGYFYMRRNTGWERGSTSWSLRCAEVMYESKRGTCYYWAASFLYLARRLGYQAYPVCGGVGTGNQLHAWVVIEWDDGQEYIFDVQLEWAYRNNFYAQEYAPDDMFKQPRDATKVIYVFPGESSQYYGVAEENNEDDLLNIPEDMIPPVEEPEETEPPEETEDPDAPEDPDVTEAPDAPEDPEEPEQTETPSEPPAESESPVATETPSEPETPVVTAPPVDPAPVQPEPVDPTPAAGGESAA